MTQPKVLPSQLDSTVVIQSELDSAVSTLNTSISGKADTSHTHAQSNITNLVTDLAAKAPLASPAFTGTPTGITATHVGLGNVDNTSNATERAATATLTNKTITAPTLSGTVAGTYTIGGTPTFPAAVTQLTTTQTLTNKRITPRIGTVTSSATPTPTGDTADQYNVTALAANATVAAPTGTPTDGQKLLLRIKDNGTARTLTWNAIYVAGPSTLPSTTVISKTHLIGFIYDSAATKWVCAASDPTGY